MVNTSLKVAASAGTVTTCPDGHRTSTVVTWGIADGTTVTGTNVADGFGFTSRRRISLRQ